MNAKQLILMLLGGIIVALMSEGLLYFIGNEYSYHIAIYLVLLGVFIALFSHAYEKAETRKNKDGGSGKI